ncbi:MAG TPA: alpha/beta hydrolase [Herpetosiphonaceae bacterium]
MATTTTPRTGYAPVNGLKLYYEIYGSGQPLILLHGGYGMVGMFATLLPGLAEDRQVIGLEMQGHGHTGDIDRPLSPEAMADDVAATIAALGFERADILGYSMGAGVALQTAIRHPEVVGKLVILSGTHRRSGLHDSVRAAFAAMNTDDMTEQLKQSPIYEFYSAVAPNLGDWPNLVAKTTAMLREDYDWSAGVATIAAPTLIALGDADMLPPAVAAELFGLLGGGKGDGSAPHNQLAILPGTDHFTILERTDLLLPILKAFFAEAQAAAVGEA